MSDLFHSQKAKSGTIECLGQTFPSDESRREHYLMLLAEKLRDPEFRKIDGFPIGSDEHILALSDPPYYTACPNPFIEDFVRHYGKPYDSTIPYSKEPFAADVSEGKNDPIYNAHSYHTKVPHKAIMRYILHYTQPGDLVFDGFCGTGMTGVAAQLCGNKNEVQSLGYQVKDDGVILKEEFDINNKKIWIPFSKLGARSAILNDLSPAASFIAYNYNNSAAIEGNDEELITLINEIEVDLKWLYETKHTTGGVGKINYTIFTDVFVCPNCAGEFPYWGAAVSKDRLTILNEFDCPHCSTKLNKRTVEHAWLNKMDIALGKAVKQIKRAPVLINYSYAGKRFEKIPDEFDLKIIHDLEEKTIPFEYPTSKIPKGDKTGEPIRIGITHAHQFYTKRNLWVLAALWAKFSKHPKGRLALTSVIIKTASLLHNVGLKDGKINLAGALPNAMYIPSNLAERNIFELVKGKISDFKNANLDRIKGKQLVCLSSLSSPLISNQAANSFDYIFIDPPFGSNLHYSELSFLWEAWLGIVTNNKCEAIENRSQNKKIDEYRILMTACFRQAFIALKPTRWITVEFSNTSASVWNSIQTSLTEAGFVIGNVAALNKGQGTFNSQTNTTSVKQDLVISAYKPDENLKKDIENSGATVNSIWDFVDGHLAHLPVVIIKNGELDFISEREPRIIFDRMIAFFIGNNAQVPMSSHEFQAALSQRHAIRDGMIFNSKQVIEYDKKRLQTAVAPQMELFVADERSAIDWLSDFLKNRPSTYQEITPEFLGQLGVGWKKHEAKPELSALLEDNFLKYDGTGEVPSQIHSYLSSNHKDLRSLDKSHPSLVSKAKDRWYVPDPNKAQDLEKKREKALLKEFQVYQAATGRKLKEFRLEVLRAGFKDAWGTKNYKVIISIAQKIPEEALQEDEKLLLWYDQALTRTEAGA
jgi:DNA modification methylase